MIENEIPESLQQKLVNASLGKLSEDECPDCKLLLNMYLNDKNSSSARQLVTARVCGYNNSFKKLGFDALDQFGNHKEIKPTNKISTTKIKYNGQFGFSDYTGDRFGKDVHANVHVLQSFFVDGLIRYVLEFPIIDLGKRMDILVNKHIKEKGQRYIRSATFSFNDLTESNITIKFVSDNIDDVKHILSTRLYNFIKGIKV
jgi:hypothetical protein